MDARERGMQPLVLRSCFSSQLHAKKLTRGGYVMMAIVTLVTSHPQASSRSWC